MHCNRLIGLALILLSTTVLRSLAAQEIDNNYTDFELLTAERIQALPPAERDAWTAYLQRSINGARRDAEVLAQECREAGLREAKPAPANSKEFELDSDTPESHYAGEEAGNLATVVISYQTPAGGWSKAISYEQGPRPKGTHWTSGKGDRWHYCGTLDNRSTTEQIRFLSHVATVTKRPDCRDSALRGIQWLLSAQYPTGGWPQNYPVESGYHEAMTLNDDAMLHVMELLQDIARGDAPFEFVDPSIRTAAGDAFQRAIAVLYKSRVTFQGQPSLWCAQHDPLTLEPIGARRKEPPSISGGESAQMLKFLMREAPITPETTEMIETGLKWLESHRLTGLRKTKNDAGKTDYVADSTSTEVYWARFYNTQTGKPMFAGAQDGIVYDTYSEMASRNKVGYDYFTTRPKDLLEKELARWKKRVEKAQ